MKMFCRDLVAFAAIILFMLEGRSQSVILTGSVSMQNSAQLTGQRQFIPDVSIRADQARPVTSDASGSFALHFVDRPIGTAVRLMASGNGLEVVNADELEAVVLGRNAPLQIIMAKAGSVDAARMRFLRISEAAIAKTYRDRMARLTDTLSSMEQRLAEIQDAIAGDVGTLGDAMILLGAQRDAAMQQAGQIAEQLARVDLDRSSDRFRGAYAALSDGDLQRALDLLSKETLEKELGEAEDLKTSGDARVAEANAAIRQLAESYSLRGQVLQTTLRYRDALRTLEARLRILEEQRDAFDPSRLAEALSDLGQLHVLLGEYPEAIALLNRGLDRAHSAGFLDHPVIPRCYARLSSATAEAGDLQRALQYADSGLTRATALFGPDDEQVADLLFQRGQVLEKRTEFVAARADVQRAADIWRRSLPPNDVRHGKGLGLIGLTYAGEGNIEPAVHYGDSSVQVLRVAEPGTEPEFAAALVNHAGFLADLSRHEESLRYYEQARSILVRVYGPDHPGSAICYTSIATVLEELEQLDSALAMHTLAKDVLERSLGPDHWNMAIVHANIAAVLEAQGDPQAALDECRRALVISALNALPPQDMVMTYNSMGVLFSTLEMTDSALFWLERALTAVEGAYGPDHLDAIFCRNNLAESLADAGSFQKSIDLLRDNAERALRVIGPQATERSYAFANMGHAFLELRRFDSALHYLDMSIPLLKADLGEGGILLAQVLRDRSNAQFLMGNAQAALTSVDSSLAILSTVVEWDHYLRGLGLQQRATCLEALGRFADAHVDLDSALVIAEHNTASRGTVVADVLAAKAGLHLVQGDTTSAVLFLDRSLQRTPTADAAWQRALLFQANGDDRSTLQEMMRCLGLQRAWRGTAPGEMQRTRDAARAIAERIGDSEALRVLDNP